MATSLFADCDLSYIVLATLPLNVSESRNFGQHTDGDPRGSVAEAWRFPIIDGYGEGKNFVANFRFNTVTFVYRRFGSTPAHVSVVGTFGDLYDPVPLRQIEGTPYFSASVVVRKGQVHFYRYLVDGEAVVDPINPQRVTLDNGRQWSRFFTQFCAQPITFERWELQLLIRLSNQVLPFHTELGQRFLDMYYSGLDQHAKDDSSMQVYRLDESVGAANYIDKILAREESHRAPDYRLCLAQIARVLVTRHPDRPPEECPRESYDELLAQMATDRVDGWDYARYQSPLFFLQLLRRHTITGAFAHPKYGGNAGSAAWSWLEERYRDPATGQTLFDWRKVIEAPLGENTQYHGIVAIARELAPTPDVPTAPKEIPTP